MVFFSAWELINYISYFSRNFFAMSRWWLFIDTSGYFNWVNLAGCDHFSIAGGKDPNCKLVCLLCWKKRPDECRACLHEVSTWCIHSHGCQGYGSTLEIELAEPSSIRRSASNLPVDGCRLRRRRFGFNGAFFATQNHVTSIAALTFFKKNIADDDLWK